MNGANTLSPDDILRRAAQLIEQGPVISARVEADQMAAALGLMYEKVVLMAHVQGASAQAAQLASCADQLRGTALSLALYARGCTPRMRPA